MTSSPYSKRTSVVTGAASGIGAALKDLLEARGERVIGVDIHETDIVADLSTPTGRAAMVDLVAHASGGRIDTIYANAGVAAAASTTVAVNYFGTLATLTGLRPLLAGSPSPRAVVTVSMASIHPVDDELVTLLLGGDEQAAITRADALAANEETGALIYASSKQALARWIRRNAAGQDWAGASIPLNAVAPGTIATPMTAPIISTPEGKEWLLSIVPMPLNGIAEPIVVARLMAWLGSAENTHLCGQVVFADGGSDVLIRGDSTW